MADIEHGFRPTNPNEEPPKGSEDGVQDTPNAQSADHYQLPDSIQLPSDETLTPHGALGIQPHEQAHAEGLVTARRAEAGSESFLDRFKKSRVAKIGTAAVALLATAGIAVGVTKGLDKGENTPTPGPQPTYSGPVTPGPSNEVSPTPAQTTEAPSPSAAETTPTFQYSPENPDQITAFDKMLTEPGGAIKFEKYPIEARTSWVLSKLSMLAQNYNPQVVLDTRTDDLTAFTFGGKDLAEYNPIANETDGTGGFRYTRHSSPRDVFAYGLLMQNMVGGFAELDENMRPAGFNQEISRALVSGRVAAVDPQTSAEYKDRVDSVMHSTKLTVQFQNALDGYTVMSGSTLHPVKVGNETYEGMTIKYQSEQGVGTVEKVFIPMKELGVDENGEPCGVWEDVETVLPGAK